MFLKRIWPRAILIAAVLQLLLSCSKQNETCTVVETNGVKTYKNKNLPADSKFSLTPVKVFTIEGIPAEITDSARLITHPFALDVDKSGNIFILDHYSSTVKKFDRDGKFVKSFGRQGNGPGEMSSSFCLSILNDTIFVEDGGSARMVKFDLEGKFIANVNLNKVSPNFLSSIQNKFFISNNFDVKMEKDGVQLGYNLALMNSKFEVTKQLNSVYLKVGPQGCNFLDLASIFAHSENEVFVAENSDSRYKIKVLDLSGNLKYQIEKDFKKIPLLKDEVEKLKKQLIKSYGPETANITTPYKKAINNMFVDKNNRLWVISSQERKPENKKNFYADIFQDGVFLNTIKLDITEGDDFFNINKQIYFKNNLIYVLDVNNTKVAVFSY